MKKKIFIIGSVGVPARYGGFETFAEQTALGLSQNYEVSVLCSSKVYDKENRSATWNNIQRIFIPYQANGFSSLLYDICGLRIARNSADVVIMLGAGAGIFLPLFNAKFRRKIWLHTDGLEWKRNKWSFIIRKFLFFSFHIGIRCAGRILIDSEQIKYVVPKKLHSRIVSLNYGGDHLPKPADIPLLKFPYALCIARAEPENNIKLLIETFVKWGKLKLVVVSNWDQSKQGRALYKRYKSHPQLELLEANYDQAVLQNYRKFCKYYIHGHSAGGTNPSLVEAMYAQRPIFALDNVFNRATTNQFAFYFGSSENLLNLLESKNEAELDSSATALINYAKENYTWATVVKSISQNIK